MRVKTVTTTYPAVTTGKNGENTTATTVQHLRVDGTVAFTRAPDGIYTYTQYANGQPVKVIRDCVLNHATDFALGDDPSGDFGITETGDGLRQITTYAYDAQQRLVETTLHAHGSTDAEKIVRKTYFSQLADGRQVALAYSDWVSSGGTFYGPVGYAVGNLSGSTELQATVAIAAAGITTAIASHIDETQSDPMAALDIGTVSSMQTAVFDDSGHHRTESRTYFAIPSSIPGTEGTHYDATRYAYDTSNRLIRTKTADGTITRTYFDTKFRPYQTKVGTNDNGETAGEGSGTNNMTLVSEQVYEDVTNRVTSTRQYYDTSSYRTTAYVHDADGRVVVTKPPAGPWSVTKYDQQGRAAAQGLYRYNATLTASTDPTSATTDRIGLNETSYDEQLTKSAYDRLGRATRQFTLAVDNDSAYADADDVAGDIVLEEHQTLYDAVDGNVLMSVSIERNYDDYRSGETTGALDSNADGTLATLTAANVKGRASISVMYYDALDRMTDSAGYGTNGGSNFTRPGSVPSRSATVLVSITVYNDDGSVLSTTDPRGKVARTTYDAAGRVTATIRNYVNGTPSSANGDDDLYVRQNYSNGLRTRYWVDIDGDGTEDSGVDQVTVYTYGTTKGASAGDSKIATGNLLQKVQYPDSSGGSDVVTFAYDSGRALIWKKDQAGNVTETEYDSGGRKQHERVTTLAGGFDGQVRRITRAYDDHSRASTVTTYDNAAAGSGSIVNEVQSTYDGWGNLMTFGVDPDSAIAGSGIPTKTVSYTYATATAGRNTIRRTGMTWPGSSPPSVSYVYSAGGTNFNYDDEASRVSKMTISSVSVAAYRYLGFGTVVGITHGEPDIYQRRYGSTSGSYPDLDTFGRVIHSRWTKDLSTDMDFVSVDVSYDENSNPLTTEDNIYSTGFDVKYAIDGLDRVTDADEGTLSSGSITGRTRRQGWTLTQTGNWYREKLNLNGDADFTDPNEHDDTRSHNAVNELTARDTDTSGSDNYTLTYDAVGNLTDDGETYVYEYDAWYRLRKIKDRGTSAVLSEHQYYGNGFRAGERYDANEDLVVDGSDPWYWFGYDERWRIVATFAGSDATPKERFLHHNAGGNGYGNSSYVDELVLRERDANTAWHSSSDGTLDERLYYCQNWRHDVTALVTSGGAMKERARYSSYGVPFGIPLGDCDGDGDVDAADQSILLGAWGTNTAACDLDLNGTIAAADQAMQLGQVGQSAGFGKLSLAGNEYGYCAYRADHAVPFLYHARSRPYITTLGRWAARDADQYADGVSMYQYVQSLPLKSTDPFGFASLTVIPNSPATSQGGCRGTCTWKFRVDGVPSGCNPTFIQKVDNNLRCGTCPTPTGGGTSCGPCNWSSSASGTYWEHAVNTPIPGGALSDMDTGNINSSSNTCVDFTQSGTVKVFCLSALKSADPTLFKGWGKGPPSGTGGGVTLSPGCGASFPISSGTWKSTNTPPAWFNTLTPIASGSRSMTAKWECGCANSRTTCSPGTP